MGLMKSLGSLIRGIKQKRQADKLGKTIVDPTRQTPQAILEAEGLTRSLANAGTMPGYDAAAQNIAAGTANQINSIKDTTNSAAESLMALSAANRNAQDAQMGLDANNAQNLLLNKQALSNFLTSVKAPQEEENFNFNVVQPWERKMKQYAALKNASGENMGNAGTMAMQSMTGLGSALSGLKGGGQAAFADTRSRANTASGVPEFTGGTANVSAATQNVGMSPDLIADPTMTNYAKRLQMLKKLKGMNALNPLG